MNTEPNTRSPQNALCRLLERFRTRQGMNTAQEAASITGQAYLFFLKDIMWTSILHYNFLFWFRSFSRTNSGSEEVDRVNTNVSWFLVRPFQLTMLFH